MTQNETFEIVKDILVESLCCDEDQVSLDTKLKGDLGCERIDYLDIAFRLSRKLGLNLDAAQLFPRKKVKELRVSDAIEFIEKALLAKV